MREPAHRVSTRAIGMWTVEALVGVAVLLAGQIVWWFVDDRASRTAHWVVGAVWLVLSIAYVVVMPRWRYRVHRWEATRARDLHPGGLAAAGAPHRPDQPCADDRPRARTGRAALPARLGHRDDGVGGGPLGIHGLDLPVAQELVESLTAAAVRERGDAT